MKRSTRKVEKRTFTLKNALPAFVSIVSRGANFTPLSELRYSDSDKFSDVEINRIVFSKANFSREQVDEYLRENDYEDYEVFEDTSAYVVPGVADEHFSDVAPIEYGDGVQFFVGKLKTPTEEAQATAEVIDTEVLEFAQQEETQMDPENEVEQTVDEVVVQEGDLSVDDLKPKVEQNEEVETVSEETDGEEGTKERTDEEVTEEVVQENDPEVTQEEVAQESESDEKPVFNDKVFREKAEAALAAFMEALEAAKSESFSSPVEEVEVFTAEQVAERIEKAVAEAVEQFKSKEIEETDENTVDETLIVVQNSQAVNSEEISVSRDKDENVVFSERKTRDLFGL